MMLEKLNIHMQKKEREAQAEPHVCQDEKTGMRRCKIIMFSNLPVPM